MDLALVTATVSVFLISIIFSMFGEGGGSLCPRSIPAAKKVRTMDKGIARMGLFLTTNLRSAAVMRQSALAVRISCE